MSITQALVSLTTGDTYIVAAPTQMTTASLNGDGVVDIVIYNTEGAQTVSALKGHGNGHFDDVIYATLAPNQVADFFTVGAINSDTKPDIAVAEFNAGDGLIDVQFGQGNGVFGQPSVIAPTSTFPSPLILTDVDHDGDQDIVRENNNKLEALINDGNGVFSAPQVIHDFGASAYTVRELVTGDFNGDGVMDVAVAGFASSVLVLEQDTNGNFQPVPTVPTSALPTAIVAADINGDGRLDLVIGAGSVAAGYSVAVAFSKVDGTFDTPIVTTVNGYTGAGIAVIDMNGDGDLDVVMTTHSGSGVDILLGKGDGTFIEQDNVGPFGGDTITTGDFNGDGKPDVAVGDHDGGVVSIMLNSTPRIMTTNKVMPDGSTYVRTYSDGHLFDLVHSGIPDKSFVMEHEVFSLEGTLTSDTRTHMDGTPDYTFSLDSGGTSTTDRFDMNGVLTSEVAITGHESDTTVYVNSVLDHETLIHENMTKEVYFHNVQGKSYTDEYRLYDKTGTLVEDCLLY